MNSLLIDVESMKNMMLSRATTQDSKNWNNSLYRHLRDTLIKNEKIKSMLPRCVHTCRNLDEFWGHIKEVSASYHGRREYLRNEFNVILEHLENESQMPSDNLITSKLDGKNGSLYIHDAWTKALERRESDPEGAITSARTLLESVCKFILDEYGVAYDDKAELPHLYKGVQGALKLAPDNHTEAIFKQILGACASIVGGLGAVRNKLSDAHGRSPKAVKPTIRHAQLAVNLAGTMADFLYSTWEHRQEQRQGVS